MSTFHPASHLCEDEWGAHHSVAGDAPRSRLYTALMDLGTPDSSDRSLTIYELLGEDYFHRLAAAFYEGVKEDEVLLPMYPEEDLSGAQDRLTWFLIQYFGGPALFNQNRGAPMLRRRHMPYEVTEEAQEHWLACMSRALDVAETPETVRPQMEAYFTRAAAAMRNR